MGEGLRGQQEERLGEKGVRDKRDDRARMLEAYICLWRLVQCFLIAMT